MAFSPQEHRAHCMAIKEVLQAGLDQPCSIGDQTETRKQRHLFLASVLQNMSAGTKGAGLSGGVAQENLWREMLADMKVGFTDQPPEGSETAEADYYFKGYPYRIRQSAIKLKTLPSRWLGVKIHQADFSELNSQRPW